MDKNYTEVTIAGKTYTLGGYEDAEYLQQIAAYINTCISDLHQMPGFLRQSADDQNMMLMTASRQERRPLRWRRRRR